MPVTLEIIEATAMATATIKIAVTERSIVSMNLYQRQQLSEFNLKVSTSQTLGPSARFSLGQAHC